MRPSLLLFPPFRLDLTNERLWRATMELPLRPKTFAVLRYLVEHPEQLVTKEELLNAVWGETVVGEDALTGCIRDLRKALGDEARRPRYIETVHRRGFRFIGEVVGSEQEEGSREQLGVSNEQEVWSEELRVRSQSGEVRSEQVAVRSEPEEVRREELIGRSNGEESQTNGNGSLASSVQRLESEPHNGSLAAVQALDPRSQPLDTAVPTHAWSSKKLLWLGAVCLLGVSAFIFSWGSLRNPPAPSVGGQSTIHNQEALPLPDKPSLIVLPLVNLSGDPEQEYFSDGLTEVLTGDLSKISSLFVIARNSAFTYKGKAVKVQDISKEMGVRYVLEGSVQKADQRVRIAVQLIDASTGYHVWSEQYDPH
jgi:TolB-like protein/DNA-binding winged helix-turn-helix (wHTH) protein